jgi:N,N'-diacetyllegionaminate synthase
MIAKIGNARIGERQKTFIVFEAGATHKGLSSAKKLVDFSKAAGADAIKFQLVSNINKITKNKKINFSYKILLKNNKFKKITEKYHKIIKRRSMNLDEWSKLFSYCKKKKIKCFCSIEDFEDIEFVALKNVDTIKISSSDCVNLPLIEYAAKTKKCIQIDTGNSTLKEIEQAISTIRSSGNNNIIVHYNPPNYPTEIRNVSLKNINYLKKKFNVVVGFSDHSPGELISYISITRGANLIEKTITLNKYEKSVEHCMSLEAHDLAKFVQNVRDIETIINSKINFIKKIKSNVKKTRKSLFCNKNIKKGEILKITDFSFLSPEAGLTPKKFYEIVKKKKLVVAVRNIKKGKRLFATDIKIK